VAVQGSDDYQIVISVSYELVIIVLFKKEKGIIGCYSWWIL
jgi:hypothetical protein